MNKISISVVVNGFQLQKPNPLPGETIGQFVIRNHPQEWRNCIDRLVHDFGATKEDCERLSRGILDVGDDKIRSEVERFMYRRLPSIRRTLMSIAELRDSFNEPPMSMLAQVSINEILVPQQLSPVNNEQIIQACRLYGAKIIWLDLVEENSFFINKVLPEIQADLIWALPGGTYFMSPTTSILFTKIITYFSEWPDLALFFDKKYSTIYRTEALRNIVKQGHTLPTETYEQGLLFQKCGYKAHAQEMDLVELEEIYRVSSNKFTKRSWVSRLFGK